MRKTTNFYGNLIHTGRLHRQLGIKSGQKIPLSLINAQLRKLEAKPQKTKVDVAKIRRLVFAKNAKTKFGK